ncbi:MAG: hypothetical protein A3G32_08935 [Deltaproteobacteria bacterium RIFCSPLOWO2_12_FULL_40_28]|nr:MAG: hypothetical protein A3C45_05785 [Deltaproteobacteria bacterium RIFCSPHIGHO2_02_FULL_40_28]OGQ19825.1 MAG: hypothetical protein A3E27_00985 [Deltaproteobacteria bacterium RIFCSPHIGHO2_12_FULL_40_32]OGQ54217.1 MAG: hypothetical protein A3G32_08935 [Deltaproteobacteria bacterium RIFCSPLOWO2_12_FULL_40_28]
MGQNLFWNNGLFQLNGETFYARETGCCEIRNGVFRLKHRLEAYIIIKTESRQNQDRIENKEEYTT